MGHAGWGEVDHVGVGWGGSCWGGVGHGGWGGSCRGEVGHDHQQLQFLDNGTIK